MMMDCPRCGFSQPKDRYCANCGLDVEHYQAKPKPFFIRLLQNSNFHLGLLVLVILVLLAFLLFKRQEMSAHRSERLLGLPIPSRLAGTPESPEGEADTPAPRPVTEDTTRREELPAAAPIASEEKALSPPTTPSAPTAATVEPKKIDLGFWEVPRETLLSLLPAGERIVESNEGHAYLFRDGSKVVEAFRSNARRLSLNRTAGLQSGAQIMVVTPASTQEPFQFGLAVQISRWENREASIRWDSQLVLSQPESPQEMANPNPAIKAAIDANMSGSSTLTPASLVLLVIEPANRHPRDEYLSKAGDGPWSIFSSENFRSGQSEWAVLVQLK